MVYCGTSRRQGDRKHSAPYRLKCLVVGAKGVGKSTIIARLTGQPHVLEQSLGKDEASHSDTFNEQTGGACIIENSDFACSSSNYGGYTMRFMDTKTGNHNPSDSPHHVHWNIGVESHGIPDAYLICFSVLDQDSFVRVWEHWLPGLHRNYGPQPTFVIGLHVDTLAAGSRTLSGSNIEEVDSDVVAKVKQTSDIHAKSHRCREVERDEAEQKAASLGVTYLEISAGDEGDKLNVLTDTIAARIIIALQRRSRDMRIKEWIDSCALTALIFAAVITLPVWLPVMWTRDKLKRKGLAKMQVIGKDTIDSAVDRWKREVVEKMRAVEEGTCEEICDGDIRVSQQRM